MTQGGPAQPVVVSTEAPDGGPARPVAIVTAPFWVGAGNPIKVATALDNRARIGGPALPVYVASGAAAGSPQAGPPIPVYVVSGGSFYEQKVLSVAPSNLIAYWPLSESSGTTIVDESGNGRNGVYTGVDLGQPGIGDGRTAPFFDGVNDYGNVFGAGLAGAFSGSELTFEAWVKVSGAGVWTDATNRFVLRFLADGSNFGRIIKTTVNNQLQYLYTAGGVNSVVSDASQSSTGWIHVAMTVSKTANQMKAYLNGAQVSTTQAVGGVWAGALSEMVIGSQGLGPSLVWSGNIAHVGIWNTPLSAAQIAQIATI